MVEVDANDWRGNKTVHSLVFLFPHNNGVRKSHFSTSGRLEGVIYGVAQVTLTTGRQINFTGVIHIWITFRRYFPSDQKAKVYNTVMESSVMEHNMAYSEKCCLFWTQ